MTGVSTLAPLLSNIVPVHDDVGYNKNSWYFWQWKWSYQGDLVNCMYVGDICFRQNTISVQNTQNIPVNDASHIELIPLLYVNIRELSDRGNTKVILSYL